MPRTRARRARALTSVLAVVAVVALAACGDDGEDASTATTVAPATSTTRVFTGDPNSVFCTLARENATRVAGVGGAASNPKQLAALLEEVAPAVREIVKVTPPELEDDIPVLAEGFEKMLESAKQGQLDLNVLADPKFQAASQNLARYASDVCGVNSGIPG